jgi:hypothetical protein
VFGLHFRMFAAEMGFPAGHGVGLMCHFQQRRLVGRAVGGWAHCNDWNDIIGTQSNVVWICLIPFH